MSYKVLAAAGLIGMSAHGQSGFGRPDVGPSIFGPSIFAQTGAVDRYSKKLAPYVASPQRVADRMLEMAHIKPNETVFDLGCGDGRVLFLAAQKYQAKAVGVEIDEKLVQSTNDSIKRQALENRVKVIAGNLLEADLTGADVVTIYLLTESNEKLRPRLEKFLRPGARVVSYDYPVPGWKANQVDKTDDSRGHVIYLYEMPPVKQ